MEFVVSQTFSEDNQHWKLSRRFCLNCPSTKAKFASPQIPYFFLQGIFYQPFFGSECSIFLASPSRASGLKCIDFFQINSHNSGQNHNMRTQRTMSWIWLIDFDWLIDFFFRSICTTLAKITIWGHGGWWVGWRTKKTKSNWCCN